MNTTAAIALLGFGLAMTGCKSASVYVAPKVTGRVVDSETQRPVEHVKVRRMSAQDRYRSMDAAKGAELMTQNSVVYTGADGSFALESVRTLAPFGNAGWWSVSLALEHSRYEKLSTSYGLAKATNTVAGEPVVDTGVILLRPRGR
jgi:hypothetical protein